MMNEKTAEGLSGVLFEWEKTEQRGQVDQKRRGYHAVKRAGDIMLSALALIVLSPVFLVTAIAIKAEDKGTIIFTQERSGKNGEPFRMYKFRSMRLDAEQIHEQMRKEYGCEEVSFKLKNDPRVTKVGRVIRATNIDELPQLINILRGDMSFVGPRPLPVYEWEEEQKRYGRRYALRNTVPQGLTCIWQISDRAEHSFEERMQMDIEYVRKCSIWMDIKLCFRTVRYVITGRAAY